ncbi:retrovirus-related Pol polyprotein from transposon 17.6 [Trichonephila clavipes]|nr:retrovirus-related Pol polyprotein from transposon 17.6 [Trichonephila clavipes]
MTSVSHREVLEQLPSSWLGRKMAQPDSVWTIISKVGIGRQNATHPHDKEKTAFTTGQELWQFKVIPFGLCNAPATFERLIETVLGGLSYEACLVYLDDIIIVGRSFEEHLKNIKRVLQKLKEANLKLSRSKCHLFRREVTYLGHIISAEGVRTDPDKISAVKYWNCPTDVHQLRSFLGLFTKGSAYGNADAFSRRLCPESFKYCSRIEKKFGVIGPIVPQVTTPSKSALDPWSKESVRKDQLAHPEIKPIIEFKESSDEKPSWQHIAPFHPTTKHYWALRTLSI